MDKEEKLKKDQEAVNEIWKAHNKEIQKRAQRIKEINYSLSLIERNIEGVKLKIERNNTILKDSPRLSAANKEFRDLLREYRINQTKLQEELHYWENK